MKTVAVSDLSAKAFQPFGSFARIVDPDSEKLGEPPVEFYRDMIPLRLGTATTASISVCRVSARPPVIDVTEFHNGTEEGILPLDDDVLIHVAPATAQDKPPVDRMEVFRVPRGTFVVLKAGTWHHAPFAAEKDVANVLIVLPERTYAVDCTVRPLQRSQRISFGG